jgi:hypothetical protein
MHQNTLHITLSWKFLLKLPRYKVPQEHSLRVSLGNSVSPKDMFQLLFTKEDVEYSDFLQQRSFGVAKVDFVNDVIAQELLYIIKEWHKGLPPLEIEGFSNTIKKYGHEATELFSYVFTSSILLVFCVYSESFLPFWNNAFSIGNDLSTNSAFAIVSCVLILWNITFRIAKKIEFHLDKK